MLKQTVAQLEENSNQHNSEGVGVDGVHHHHHHHHPAGMLMAGGSHLQKNKNDAGNKSASLSAHEDTQKFKAEAQQIEASYQ